MKTLLFTSIVIIGLAGSSVARAADVPYPEPHNKKCPSMFVSDVPYPEPGNKKVPGSLY